MVWMIKIVFLFFLFFSQYLFSNNLNDEEIMYFNFIDFNNDGQISVSELEQSTRIIFQLVDLNQDGFISQSEINELKNIVDSLK